MNLILLGYRGSGKSTVGRIVADRLALSFVDTDEEIQRRFGNRTIKDIWHRYGPRAFRDIEAIVVDELTDNTNQVLALGGGTVIEPDARAAIQRAPHAIRFYLQCDPVELERRLADDPSRKDRPSYGYPANFNEHIREHLDEREPIYRMVADHEIAVTGRSVEDVATEVVRIVKQGNRQDAKSAKRDEQSRDRS